MKKKKIHLIADVIVFFVLIVLDQFTKHLAVIYLKDKPPRDIVPGVFLLDYLENTGAAFGILKNQRFAFVIVAVVMLSAICYVLMKLPETKKYRFLHLLLVLIASGGIGNMIDRARTGYVVDFFYFSLINFPVFNVADIIITFSTFLLGILLLFFMKDDDFKFLKIREDKTVRQRSGMDSDE